MHDIICVPKNKAPGDWPKELHCPCDRCTHTFISPVLIDALAILSEEERRFEVISGYSCQLNWLGRHGCTSGNKCLQGLAIRVRFHVGEGDVELPGCKVTSLSSTEFEISVLK